MSRFAQACYDARKRSGLKGDALRRACEQLARERGEWFRVLPSDISRYEQGTYLPSLQKFLGLLWLLGQPAEHYLKAMGLETDRICSHQLTPEEQEIVDLLKQDPDQAELHRRLQQILEHGSDDEKQAVETLIRVVAGKAATSEHQSRSQPSPTAGDRVVQYRPKPSPKIGLLDDLRPDEHDEPRPLVTARLPYFEYRIPAGPPDQVESDGYQTVDVLQHLATESRYVVRVAGDSMEPEILDGDLLLVDYGEEPRNGKIVCALVNGKGTVKRFWKRDPKIVLKATNPKHQDIPVTEENDFRIQGVVVAITREMRR